MSSQSRLDLRASDKFREMWTEDIWKRYWLESMTPSARRINPSTRDTLTCWYSAPGHS